MYSQDLDVLLRRLGETGYCCYRWPQLRELIAFRIYMIATDVYDELGEPGPLINPLTIAQKALSYLQGFPHYPPFTLQRLCELVVEPQKHFKKMATVMIMIERCLKVNSTAPIRDIPLAYEADDVMED